MPKQLKIILKAVTIGLEPTAKQSAQREKFTQAAKECKEHFAGSKLRGAAKIRAINRFMSEHLKH